MTPTRQTSTLLPAFVLAAALPVFADSAKVPDYPDHARVMVVRDGDGGERPVKTVADWEVRRGHILAHVQEVMGPLPDDDRLAPLDWRILETHKEDGYTRHKIDFQSEPGDRVPAWLTIPDGPPGAKHPAMLCLHQTIGIGKDEPMGIGGKPTLHYARELAGRGYVTLSPDYPNFGEYQRDVYAMGYASASMKAIWNNKRAVDLLSSLPEVDPDRIGVIGHSLGGHNAIFTALFEPRLKVVVSSCGFNAFAHHHGGDMAGWSHKGYMPRLRERYNLDLNRIPFDFPELISALAPRPFFTNSPLHDDDFAIEGVPICINAARPVYALYDAEKNLRAVYPNGGHDFDDETRAEAYKFLDARLKP